MMQSNAIRKTIYPKLSFNRVECLIFKLKYYGENNVILRLSFTTGIRDYVGWYQQPTINVMIFDWIWAVKWDKLDNLSGNVFIVWSVLNSNRKLPCIVLYAKTTESLLDLAGMQITLKWMYTNDYQSLM